MTRILTLLLAAVLPGAALADARELTTTQSIRIKASTEQVWAVAGDFAGLARWFPPAQSSRLVLRDRNEEGAIRELVRRNGTRVTERLVEYDPWNMRLTYTYVDGMVAASDYFATVQVRDAGGGETEVVWSARFTRLNYWQDPPPAGQEDETLVKFFAGVYRTGLEYLRQVVEQGQ